MFPNRFDAAIVGGGPGGSACALALRKHERRVLIIERSRYDNWRFGETLPARARTVLIDLGVGDDFLRAEHMPSYAIRSTWGGPGHYEANSILNSYGVGWHVDRKKFDLTLANAAREAGATLLTGARVRRIAREGPGWRLKIESDESPHEIEASFLVDGTGADSRVARLLGAKRSSHDHLSGVAGQLWPESPNAAVESLLTVEAVENGWWYCAPLPDGTLLATFMTDVDRLAKGRNRPRDVWSAELNRTALTRERCSAFRWNGVVKVRNANSSRLDTPAGEGWLAVGDAASSYDPLSGAGIAKALHTGLRGAQAIAGSLDGDPTALDSYAAAVFRSYTRYLNQRMEYYCQEHRWPTSLFWRRRNPDAPAV